MTAPIKSPKKLIEVALPLDAINVASAREKSIRHGHPSTLHLWWARRPLAAARAVIFAQMVNDPGGERGYFAGMTKAQAAVKREELFKIIEDLVQWENTNNEAVLERARAAIRDSWIETCRMNQQHPQAAELFNPNSPPDLYDPFAGGGAIPLEAQRLGLRAWASDLNPVAVAINRAAIEVPALLRSQGPIFPRAKSDQATIFDEKDPSESNLGSDVLQYGLWMRDQAYARLREHYPKVTVCREDADERPELEGLVGQELTVIAWLWARTVKSPNPAFTHAETPLVSTFSISSKAGKEAFVEPIVTGDQFKFLVRSGKTPEALRDGLVNRKGATCLLSDTHIPFKYIRAEASAGRMGARLMAIVAEGPKGRVFLSPNTAHADAARCTAPETLPDLPICHWPGRTNVVEYGMRSFMDLFSPRQKMMLSTLVQLVPAVVEKAKADAIAAGLKDDGTCLRNSGNSAAAYAEAIGVYLTFLISQIANHSSTVCGWNHPNTQMRSVFSRQALPMTWDYAEANVFSESSGSFINLLERQAKGFTALGVGKPGVVFQADARNQSISTNKVVSTDPPYYDNISYAELSDFFYVWMRQGLKGIYPDDFTTMATPKATELIAAPYRQGGKVAAERYFLEGMTDALEALASQCHGAYPITIYYAFKQSESEPSLEGGRTGWETFLQAVIDAGLTITGTWPMRTEKEGRAIGNGANALASSIVLVCRRRSPEASAIGRRAFVRELNSALPDALDEMTRGGVNSPVAPVDLSQAIIGPGMAIFSQYSAVLEADGSKMSVKTALQLINRFLAEDDFDHDTQFCLAWFEQRGWATGKFGEGDVLARAKGTSVGGLNDAGVLESNGGNLRLLRWAELDAGWSPEDDARTPVWEALHQLIRALNNVGESAAGALLARMPARAEPMRALAYRLYTLCERQGWADDARAYNELVAAWSSIEAAAAESGPIGQQTQLDY